MSVLIKPGMQPHNMPGNSLGSPSNLLGDVSTSLMSPDLSAPAAQPVVADPISQPADAYVVQHPPAKRHLGQRGGLVGGVLLTAGLLLGAASLSEPTVDIDYIPDGLTRYLGGEVPGLGNTDMASAQLFAEIDGELFPMEVVSGIHSDLLSGGTMASLGTNFATVLADASKPNRKWGKVKKWLGNNKGTKWLQKKLKKPAGWVSKHPFAAMGIMAGLFLLNLITIRKWMKARASKSGKKVYLNDIPQGHYFDTGTIFVANAKNDDGGHQIIRSSRPQRDVLVKFTKDPQRKLVDVLHELYPRRRDEAERKTAQDNTEQEIVKRRGWLMEMPTQPGEDKGYTLTLTPYKVGRIKRRWRYWRCTKRDNKLNWARWIVEQDRKKETLPWANRWVGWVPGGMSLKKADKIVTKADKAEKTDKTVAVSSPEIVGSIDSGRMTAKILKECYIVKEGTVIIHGTSDDPLIYEGWQAVAILKCADKDQGPTPSLIMTSLGQYPEATEDTVRAFLEELVTAKIMEKKHDRNHYELRLEKGSDEDAKRISGGKEPVTGYTPPAPPSPPKPPKSKKPQYKMNTDNSAIYIVMPNGDVDVVKEWRLRALSAARAPTADDVKTTDQIFENIGMTEDDRSEFSLFINIAIAKKWLLDLGDSKVQFILEEGDFIPPKSPAPRHPKAVPAMPDGTGTGEWTGMLEKKPAPAPKPSSPPEAAPPVVANPAPETSTRLGNAPTEFVKGSEVAKLSQPPAQKEPEPPRVKAKPLVPELRLPQKVAAASVTPPAPPEPEDVVVLVADLPQPLGRDGTSTVMLTPSAVGGLADDSKPQTAVGTKIKLGAGTATDPHFLTKPLQSGDEAPATVAVTYDKPADAELADNDQTTGQFRRSEVSEPSVVVDDSLIIEEEDTEPELKGVAPSPIPPEDRTTNVVNKADVEKAVAESAGKRPPPRKRKRRPGESRMTIRRDPEGVDGHTIELETSDLVEIGDDDGDGSDEG